MKRKRRQQITALSIIIILMVLFENSGTGSLSNYKGSDFQETPPSLIRESENIISTEPGLWMGYNVPRKEPVRFIFRNNTVVSSNSSGYLLQAGDENPSEYNNKLDGELISGNKFIWNGTDKNSITHGVFTGYTVNVLIRYNYLERVPMGLIRKSNGMTDFSGGIAYNIVNNPLKVAIAIKGINNIKILNNTFYSERTPAETWRPLVHIYSNDSPAAASTGTRIFNNIFYTKHSIFNITVENNCLEGFECDYNIYYCEEGEPRFLIGDEVKTFTQWKSMGYDLHSQVIDPRFNNFRDFVPAVRLDFGKDLGPEWKEGLSVKAVWNNKDPETTDQNGVWQVGARIHEEQKSSNYYVATDGDDENQGTITAPFGTWQKGFSTVKPGDTLFIRGGTYYPGPENVRNVFGSDFYCGVCIIKRKGSVDKPITVLAFNDEKPVLDCRKITAPGYKAGIILQECDYWFLKGLKVTRADQVSGFGAFGIYLNNCNHNTLEQIVSCNHGGSGIRIGYESESNLLLNCDAFNCYDSLTVYKNGQYHGGHADGIEVSDIFERNGNERINRIVGCRSWNNSDDGYDFFKCEGIIIMERCWAWENGYDKGDGSGFKLGTTKGIPEKVPQRVLTDCLAFSNSGIGFDQNGANVIMKLENCKSYSNGTYGYNFQWNNVSDTLINNISHKNGKTDIFMENQIAMNNSWQKKVKLTDACFLTISPHGIDGARQSGGDLPVIKFLTMKKGAERRVHKEIR